MEKDAQNEEVPRQIDPLKPMIALTFDDGPHSVYTNHILDVLKMYNAKATFFVLGDRIEKNKAVIKRISDEGHEIGNHSFDHKGLLMLDYEGIKWEIETTNSAVEAVTGKYCTLIRPPYGDYNDYIINNIGQPLIMWSVDTEDWKYKNTQTIINSALKNPKDGDIILMHDIHETSAAAVKTIVEELTDRGFQLVTVNEMYGSQKIAIKAGAVYHRAIVNSKRRMTNGMLEM